MSHTPGPWTWCRDTGYPETRLTQVGVALDVAGLPVEQVLSIYESHGGGNTPSEADAALIAAAPDLLEALEEAKACLIMEGYRTQHGYAVLTQIDAAIAKARGL